MASPRWAPRSPFASLVASLKGSPKSEPPTSFSRTTSYSVHSVHSSCSTHSKSTTANVVELALHNSVGFDRARLSPTLPFG